MTITHRRERYQQGSLTIEKRKHHCSVLVYRWREPRHGGGSVQRKNIIGTKQQYPTKTAALKAVSGLRLDINSCVAAPLRDVTLDEVIAHYKEIELADSNRNTTRTKEVYRYQLEKVVSPKWGALRLSQVRPVAVERWLNEIPGAPGTRYKTKGVMSVLFQHAMRYEWTTTNPIRLVRQSALPEQEEIVLEAFEIAILLSELRDPFQTLILLASVTGLRRGELFGLKWNDLSFADREIRINRSVVDQVVGLPKTLASRRPVPMSSALADALANWRRQTSFPKQDDWVFASPRAAGARAYWPDAVLKRHVYPAAERAGITKRIGWHSFRRTLATLLQSSGASVKTTQELLRHASPGITMGIYAKAVTADKRQAQDTIAAMFVGNSNRRVATTGEA
jgi:integrase